MTKVLDAFLRHSMVIALVLASCAGAHNPPSDRTDDFPRLGTAAEIDAFKSKSSNWGRWGAHDELGAANLISQETRRRASNLVRDGIAISLAHLLETTVAPDVPFPLEHAMLTTGEPSDSQFSTDKIAIAFHGWSHTHLDALCHIFDKGVMYNGHPQSLVTDAGCKALSIQTLQHGIFTRGVLVDMAAFKGVPYLEPGTPISAEDLVKWERATDTFVEPGDAVVVRTGRWARRAAVGAWDVSAHSAGLDASTAAWFKARGVSMVGTDVGADVIPSGVEGVPMPVHVLLLNTLGIYILDDCDLEIVAKTASEKKRTTFLFQLAPLAIRGGTGSPVNPLAIF